MGYNNTSQAFARPNYKVDAKMLFSQNIIAWTRDLVLLRAIAKVTLLVMPIILAVHLGFAALISNLELTLVELDDRHHQLVDENINLRALKARAFSPANVAQLAEERLELYGAKNGQIGVFNRRSGRFTYN